MANNNSKSQKMIECVRNKLEFFEESLEEAQLNDSDSIEYWGHMRAVASVILNELIEIENG